MSTDATVKPGEIGVVQTFQGKVTHIRLGKHKGAIAIGRGALKRAGLTEGDLLTAELMSDGSLVLRSVKAQPQSAEADAAFENALEEANRRFGNAFRRLAE